MRDHFAERPLVDTASMVENGIGFSTGRDGDQHQRLLARASSRVVVYKAACLAAFHIFRRTPWVSARRLGGLVVLLAVASPVPAQTPSVNLLEGAKVHSNLEYVKGGHERQLFIVHGEQDPLVLHHQSSASPEPDRRSLKEAVGDRFKIGVGVRYRVLQQPEDATLIRQHFQILTPENSMKPQSIHPAENTWNFEAADRFAEFVRANKLEMVGHCLVWAKDDRTDEWMKRENGKPVSRETLLRRIETHIETVAGRYADVATQWDVVNEAIGDGNEGLLRDSVYSRTTGIDFIVTAFKTARQRPECSLDLQRL